MDVDEPSLMSRSTAASLNAIAGPSSRPDIPILFLQDEGHPLAKPPLFHSRQDLISRFQLLSAYDKYVRPHIHSVADDRGPSLPPSSPIERGQGPLHIHSSSEKGKGRESTIELDPLASVPTPGLSGQADGGDGDENENAEKGEKKTKNSYRHLIKGIPVGKHSMKKDDYLQTIMQIPPKQKMNIMPFDARTQRDAFSVSLEGLKGWNIKTLVAESAQAREDRKKKKELKKLSKLQATGVSGSGPLSASLISPSNNSTTPIPAAGTPPALPSTASANANVMQHSRMPQTPLSTGAGTPLPTPISQQRASSRPPASPLHTNPPPVQAGLPPSTRPSTRPGVAPDLIVDGFRRPQKRELEDDTQSRGVDPLHGSYLQRKPETPFAGLKSVNGTSSTIEGRPRPLKKAKMDHSALGLQNHGMEREIRQPHPHQQPTPQGVQ